MRIGVFGARGIPSTYSGYETFLTVLLPALVERGHEVTIYCRSDDAELERYRGVERIPLRSIKTKQLDTLTHGWVAARRALGQHDVVLAVNLANLPAANWLSRRGTPVLINVDGQEWLRGKWGAAAKWYFRYCARRTRVARAVILNDCDAMAAHYLREFGTKSLVANYCWTGIADDLEYAEVEHRLRRFGLTWREFYFVGGRLVPENNIAEIACSLTRNRRRHAVVVAGDANYDSPVMRALLLLKTQSDLVQLVGHIEDRRDFASLLAGARTYVHGHSVGGINPSLLEAMACGAAIAALDTPFNREALGDAGQYFPRPDDAVSAVFEAQSKKAENARRAATSRVHKRFPMERSVVEYEAALVHAATGQPGGARRRWPKTQLS